MSGHSKWATIKHAKGAADAKRGQLFTKFIKEISIAARMGGGDPNSNPRLRTAILKARASNMPKDNIERAIKKGTGELGNAVFEEKVYEGYGPAGVALIVETTTDNKNRTASDIRKIFSKHSGSMGETGCVGWMFSKKGFIAIDKSAGDEDTIMTIALDAGAEDFVAEEDSYEIYTTTNDFNTVLDAIKAKNIEVAESEISMVPQTYVKLEGENAEHMLKLLDELEEHDDVKNVFSNFDISKEDMEKYGA